MAEDIKLGELTRRNPRDVWAHEAHDFTPWLAENLDQLAAQLHMDLELVEQEASAGDFWLDLLARDVGTDKAVVIENQLESTDHDHLGKVLTYAAYFEAATVIWVCPGFRDEHLRTLDWLNRMTSSEVSFFGVQVEVLQIDESRPAVSLRVVASPAEWRPALGRRRRGTSAGASSKGEAYRAYFQELIDEMREKHRFTQARAGQPQSWYMFSSGIQGIGYGASFALGGKARAEVYIDTQDGDRNENVFDALQEAKEEIEKALGEEVSWERLDGKRSCRLAVYRAGTVLDEPSVLEGIRDWHVDRLLKLKAVLGKRLKRAIAAS